MNPVLPQSRLSTDPLFCLEIVKITISKNIYYWGFENSLNTREGKWGKTNNIFVPASQPLSYSIFVLLACSKKSNWWPKINVSLTDYHREEDRTLLMYIRDEKVILGREVIRCFGISLGPYCTNTSKLQSEKYVNIHTHTPPPKKVL